MTGTGHRNNAHYIEIGGKSPNNGIFTDDHESDSGFLTAVWASIQTPTSGDCISHPDLCANEVLHITRHLRNIDGKFRNFRELFQKEGPVVSGPVEAKLVDLLQAISSLLYKYPALNGEIIQPATAALINSVNGLNNPVKGSENRKRYSDIFGCLDALEISLGNGAADMFISDIDSPGTTDLTSETETSPKNKSFCKSKSNSEGKVQTDISDVTMTQSRRDAYISLWSV